MITPCSELLSKNGRLRSMSFPNCSYRVRSMCFPTCSLLRLIKQQQTEVLNTSVISDMWYAEIPKQITAFQFILNQQHKHNRHLKKSILTFASGIRKGAFFTILFARVFAIEACGEKII